MAEFGVDNQLVSRALARDSTRMGIEVERKFLLRALPPVVPVGSSSILQGYLTCDDAGANASVRVRVADGAAWFTVKSGGPGQSRLEFEYSIPLADAEEMISRLCYNRVLRKKRLTAEACGSIWTIDVFEGRLQGLILAEVELDSPDSVISLPTWADTEVTGRPEFLNGSLATLTALEDWLVRASVFNGR